MTDTDVAQVILKGKMIEEYPERYPPGCLISGKTNKGRQLHVLVYHLNEAPFVLIYTMYQPDSRWKGKAKTQQKKKRKSL